MLLDYDTIIVDLDFTIWDGYKSQYWARLLEPPFKLEGNRFSGVHSDHIDFHDGIFETLKALHDNKKNIGFASRGAADNVLYNNQPSIIALKSFGIYDYFNYQKILVTKTINKIPLLKPLGKTIYIDDNNGELEKVSAIHGNTIDIINRNTFNNWWSIL